MKNKPLKFAAYVFVAYILIISSTCLAKEITDPVADFVATFHRDAGDKVYRLRCDLENNGGEAVFLAFGSYIDDDGDCGWALYLKRGNKYIRPVYIDEQGVKQDTGPTFNIHRYLIGYIKEIKKFGLLTSEISLGHGGGAQLRAVIVTGDHFIETNVGSFKPYVATDPVEKSPFPDPPTPAIEVLNP